MKRAEELFTPNCVRVRSGEYVNVLEPTESVIHIEDIAHSLSLQCRFSGHLPKFYSVAQHSVHCAEIATQENKLAALLHDASEAYLVDIARPVKQNLSNYKEIEDRFMIVIASKFKFQWPMSEEVRVIDDILLKKEWEELMLEGNSEFECWSPEKSKRMFLEMYNSLTVNS